MHFELQQLPYKKGGVACCENLNEPLKGNHLSVD